MPEPKSDDADKRPALETQRQLAEAVRWLRFERRWSQEELAERSCVHGPISAKWSGRNAVSA